MSMCEQKKLKSFDFQDHRFYELENSIDPDTHFYQNVNMTCEYYSEEELNTKKKGFSLIHFNSRSLYSNFAKIKDYLKQFQEKFTVVAISETWLSNDKELDDGLEGYEMFWQNRVNRRGGGVAIFVVLGFKCKVINNMTAVIDNLMECLTIAIKVERAKNILISCIYRTPGSCIDYFNTKTLEILEKHKDKVTFVCGDFNIDLLKSSEHKKTAEFIDTMFSLGFYPLILKPSRITKDSATLIDNIFVNITEGKINSGLLVTDVSDHLPVFAVLERNNKFNLPEKIQTHYSGRVKTPEAIAALKMGLANHDWQEVYVENTNDAYNAFLDTFLTLYDRYCPVKKLTQNSKTRRKSWITKGLEKSCKKKNKLYREFLKHRTKEKEDNYKKYRNRLTSIMRCQKKMYYEQLLQKYKKNIKATWSVLNKVIKNCNDRCFPTNIAIGDNTVIEDIESMVNKFNEYFVNIGPNLAKEIPLVGGNETFNLPFNKCNTMFLGGVCESDILEVVKEFKSKKSTDCNDLNMSLIKEVIFCVLEPLTYICNKSFQTGIFPDKMKIAKVIPIYKNGDKQSVSNYRPISLLPQFSKILEKLFVKRLDSFIEKYDILNDYQYGFRRNRSTSLAVMEFVENIATVLDNKQFGVGVFIDLRKAFDTIDHSLLLQKCERYGIRGIAQLWLRSYLNNRLQYVSNDDIKSHLKHVICGVPQGSVLGPKLFILYINDICTVSDTLKCVMFADDTNLFCSGGNIKDLLITVEIELMKLNKWFALNKLSLNESKTKFMLFGGKTTNIEVKLNLNNVEIERVYETKFLGVIIDDKVCWKPHIKYVKQKLSKSISILYKTRDLLNKNCLHLLYFSLVMPYMTYCAEIWGNVYKTNLDPIIKLQKRAIRIINEVGYHDSTNQLFIRSQTIKFLDIVYSKTLQIMFRVVNKTIPVCIQKLFKLRQGIYNLRGLLMFETSKVRTNLKYRCVSVLGAKLWNGLSDEIKMCTSMLVFKKTLKSKIIKGYNEI